MAVRTEDKKIAFINKLKNIFNGNFLKVNFLCVQGTQVDHIMMVPEVIVNNYSSNGSYHLQGCNEV